VTGRPVLGAIALLLPTTAAAECLGQGCYDGLAAMVGGAIAVGVMLVLSIGMAFFQKTRRAALIVFLAMLALIVTMVVVFD
jgi:hypothetical protein